MTTTTESHSYSPNWGKAVIAGIVATVAITLTMALFGQNILKMLGSMMLPESGTTMQYIAGGIMHFAVGIVYALIFAWLLGPVRARGPIAKGILYGLATTAIALALMPVMSQAMPGGGAGNPCNPCSGAAASNPCNPCSGAKAENPCNPCNPCGDDHAAMNPCNPCSDEKAGNPCNPCGDDHAAMNPCNPCSEEKAGNPCNPCGEDHAAMNPCNPCNPCSGTKAGNPCNPCSSTKAGNPCNPCSGGAGNPCNPCGGGGSPYSSLISAVNHLVYGLVLALVYGRD